METGTETFLSHLIELRDRLIRVPRSWSASRSSRRFIYSAELYDFLAQPVIASLPTGSR